MSHKSQKKSKRGWWSGPFGKRELAATLPRITTERESSADKSARTTARATKWIAVFTVVLAAVSIGTGFILKNQLWEMRNDERAWLKIMDAPSAKDFRPNAGAKFFLPLQVINIGKTPALEMFFQSDAKLVAVGAEPEISFGDSHVTLSGSILYPNDPFDTFAMKLPPDHQLYEPLDPALFNPGDASSMAGGEDYAIFFARVEYKDVFGRHHWAQYCAVRASEKAHWSKKCTDYNGVDSE